MPKAAVDLPLPLPVWTMRRPFSSVLVAMILSRAAFCLRIFSACAGVELVFAAVSRRCLSCDILPARQTSRQLGDRRCCGAARQRPRSIASRKRAAISCKRRRVVLGDEVAHRLVAEIGVVSRSKWWSSTAPRGGGEGEQVVDRRGDLEGALVAVAHHAGDPFRVGGAAAHDAARSPRRARGSTGRSGREWSL